MLAAAESKGATCRRGWRVTTNSFRVSLGHNFNVLNLDSDDSCVPLSTYHKAPKCENKIIIYGVKIAS